MKWQDRQRSTNIVDLNADPMAALIHNEMLAQTLPPELRIRQVPWVAGQAEAIRRYIPPQQVTSERVYHSPGGEIRRRRYNEQLPEN